MAYWTVLGRGIEAEGTGKSFGVTLTTDNNSWSAQGPDVAVFFTHRSGQFTFASLPERGVQLTIAVSGKATEVAFFRNLQSSSAVGDTNSGRASEKGLNFQWTLNSK